MLAAAPDDLRGARSETTILFLAANPLENPSLQLGEECRAIEDKIRGARFREKLRFRSRWATRPDDLIQALHEDDPTVLHFSGHGAGAQGLCFVADNGHALLVNSDGLGQVIRAAGDGIQLVVLNACYTNIQAEALVAHIPCVIGMPSTIGDKSAIVYAAELYRALAFGKSVASAHQCGLAALALHSMEDNMRDVDVAEAVLRRGPPELLVRTGMDASQVHIVQDALPSRPQLPSSSESRIHLEIDIDADFETLDASMLSKLMSEIRRLSGGRPVRILCVTKGSIRLYVSFEPDAAKSLISLRDSGQLKQIGGFEVSNLVDLGQVEISAQSLEPGDQRALIPALTIVSHPMTHRIGERCLLDELATGSEVSLSRNAPDFSRPDRILGQPLDDPFVSRTPIRFAPEPGGGVRVIADAGGTPVVSGALIDGSAVFAAGELAGGVTLELARRVVLLLHLVDRRVEDIGDPLGMVGASEGIRQVRTAIDRVADLPVPVLIRGETGTGKELVARAIHDRSPRRDGPFISVNLGAIPRELAAAELFGSTRGAFAGARARDGWFRAAHGGTLFLDEIGDAPPEVQVRLLRVLETGEIFPVGGEKPVAVQVRLITATDANLEDQIRAGQFRAPLLHRLAGYEVRIPPLRDRREDIGPLFYHFAREELSAIGEGHRISPQDDYARPWLPAHLAAQLVRYAWPGNVRELRNVTRQLVIESRSLSQLRMDPRLADQLGMAPRPSEPGKPGLAWPRGSEPPLVTEDEFEVAAINRGRGTGGSSHLSGKATTLLHAVLEDAAPALTRIAQRLYENTQDADDLLQDTIECAMREGMPADVQNPRAWLVRITFDLFMDRCRATAHAAVHESLDEIHNYVRLRGEVKRSIAPRPPSDPSIEVRRRPSDVTEQELVDALRASAWDINAAADRLHIPRPSIYDLIERSPDLRTSGDLRTDEIEQCFHACAGDLDAMVVRLQVSRYLLSHWLRELGLVARPKP